MLFATFKNTHYFPIKTIELPLFIEIPLDIALPPIVRELTMPVSIRLGNIPLRLNFATSSETIRVVVAPEIIPAISPITSQHKFAS